ncbi:CDP-alcohol phosphatidyltransferase family protein [Clostridium sporogenes]|uniref:CDP-alcohol phosphatidyltransferase family protein n=1 Tax=Clostridium sporogenes TaxID=1509 RepID=UPI0005F8AF36|nr:MULTISPECIES: CDP-alcohol phosphatidyltransferase family protein [Clostridium]EJE7236221.1 CDP-alcohol phosphatidyltransferase family protein [Clostridium botulinum]MBO0576530.1 CDP-alcohol phosphatidyltransferase family protein [Clostridium botulinum]NFP91144.1 CDP-alcohol phosphatidyltransferase family protein [Clostridium sporogenes]HDK7169512.1 CDP-alcohol phosphatidyltransferase family protein [Clostridium botulinum]
MRTPRCIPNVLTGLRMVLTFIYLLFLENLNLYSNNKLYFASAGIVFFLICVTDFIDGKIARKIKAESLLGSFLDVTADFIFIISSLALLNLNNRIPIWFTVLTLIKFIEFFITSYIIKKYYNVSNNFFQFDYFGRIAAMNFFLIPGMVLLTYIGLNIIYINMLIWITLILVIISFSVRCTKVIKCLS